MRKGPTCIGMPIPIMGQEGIGAGAAAAAGCSAGARASFFFITSENFFDLSSNSTMSVSFTRLAAAAADATVRCNTAESSRDAGLT